MNRRRHYFHEWDYYSESQPRKVDKGIKTKSERGAIGETWWSKRWVHALESLGMGSRLTRGRSYARMGHYAIPIKLIFVYSHSRTQIGPG